MNRTLAAYIRSQMMACLIVGIVCTVGLYVIGVPYALALGVIAGVLEFVPLAGPLLAAASRGMVNSFHSLSLAFWVLIFLAVVRIVEDYVIYTQPFLESQRMWYPRLACHFDLVLTENILCYE